MLPDRAFHESVMDRTTSVTTATENRSGRAANPLICRRPDRRGRASRVTVLPNSVTPKSLAAFMNLRAEWDPRCVKCHRRGPNLTPTMQCKAAIREDTSYSRQFPAVVLA
jgi:hypothetical protein